MPLPWPLCGDGPSRLARAGLRVAALWALATGVALADGPRSPEGGAFRPSRPSVGRTAARPTVPPAYFAIVRSWHTPTPGATQTRDPGTTRPMLIFRAMHLKETVQLKAKTDDGGFSPDDQARATHVLRQPGTNKEHPVEPRVLDVFYKIQTRFHAEEIRIVSAYRAPEPGRTMHGNHGRGRAIDFVLPGVDDEDVAKFARGLGFVGCGVYPISGFVHVDVRDRSYFWRDASGPGHKSRERGILLELARRSDDDARARGEAPPPPYLLPGAPAGVPSAVEEEEEDDDG